MIKPDLPTDPAEWVGIEVVLSKTTQTIPWRDLQNADDWFQGRV